MMPYVTSFFEPRRDGDRPKVVPDGSVNLAFVGQYAETPRDVVTGGDHPTSLSRAANRQRNLTQCRVVAHLDRRKEAIHVDMNDLSHKV